MIGLKQGYTALTPVLQLWPIRSRNLVWTKRTVQNIWHASVIFAFTMWLPILCQCTVGNSFFRSCSQLCILSREICFHWTAVMHRTIFPSCPPGAFFKYSWAEFWLYFCFMAVTVKVREGLFRLGLEWAFTPVVCQLLHSKTSSHLFSDADVSTSTMKKLEHKGL